MENAFCITLTYPGNIFDKTLVQKYIIENLDTEKLSNVSIKHFNSLPTWVLETFLLSGCTMKNISLSPKFCASVLQDEERLEFAIKNFGTENIIWLSTLAECLTDEQWKTFLYYNDAPIIQPSTLSAIRDISKNRPKLDRLVQFLNKNPRNSLSGRKELEKRLTDFMIENGLKDIQDIVDVLVNRDN